MTQKKLPAKERRRLAIQKLHQDIARAIAAFEKNVYGQGWKPSELGPARAFQKAYQPVVDATADALEAMERKLASKRTITNGSKTTFDTVDEIRAVLPPEEPKAKRGRRRRSSMMEHVIPMRSDRLEDLEQEDDDRGGLGKGQLRSLVAMAEAGEGGITRTMLTILLGFRRSTRDRYLSNLKRWGLAQERGDRWFITSAGRTHLPRNWMPLPKGEALRDLYVRSLPEGESAIASILFHAWPNEIEREAIDRATSYTRSTRDRYLSRLIARQIAIASRPGYVIASKHLFEREQNS